MNGISDWVDEQVDYLARLVVSMAILAAVVTLWAEVEGTLRASQEGRGLCDYRCRLNGGEASCAAGSEPRGALRGTGARASKALESDAMNVREPGNRATARTGVGKPVFCWAIRGRVTRRNASKSLGEVDFWGAGSGFSGASARVESPSLTPWGVGLSDGARAAGCSAQHRFHRDLTTSKLAGKLLCAATALDSGANGSLASGAGRAAESAQTARVPVCPLHFNAWLRVIARSIKRKWPDACHAGH